MADASASMPPSPLTPLAPSRVGHATWSSRVGDRAEISLRYLRAGALVVERTLLVYEAGGGGVLSTLVSEETFVRDETRAG